MAAFRPTCSLCEVEFDGHVEHVVLLDGNTRPSRPEDLKSVDVIYRLQATGTCMWPGWEDDENEPWSMVAHLSCAELVLRHGPVVWNVAEILDSAFALSRTVSRARQRWFQKLVEDCFYEHESVDRMHEDDCLPVLSILKRLPLEVTRHIISLCLPTIQILYGILSYETHAGDFSSIMRQRKMFAGLPLSHKESEAANYQVSQSGPILASFVPFQGRHYVKCISETRIQGDFSVMLKSADKAGTTMYVAHDHLGVRRIVCTTPESAEISKIQEEPGLWWHTIPWRGDYTKIQAESDGVKIRSLYREGERDHDRHYWPRPMSPLSYPKIIDIHRTQRNFPPIRRMNSLVLNGVGMRSMSASILRHCSTIFAHYAGIPDLNYENAPSQASGNKVLWLHFILDEREQISEIWTWANPIGQKGIVFRTSKGRVWTCSLQPSQDALHRWDHRVTTTWEHLADLPPNEPTTIFLEESWGSIGQLALQSEAPIQGAREPPIEDVTVEEGPDNQPDWVTEYSWGTHYSSAPLSGLSTITPCWGKTSSLNYQDVEGVLGLLLQYDDGRARVLGQVRLDSLGEPLDVTNCDGISLKHVWKEAVLEDVRLGRVGEDGWMWMPLEGSMTWWFDGRCWGESYWSWTSSYYCFIKHFGQNRDVR